MAGEVFRDWLISELGSGGLDAKKVCTISFMAAASGACGVSDLGYNPDAPSDGHFYSHLKLVLRLEAINSKFYWIRSPMTGKHAQGREKVWVPILNPVEEIENQFSGKLSDFWGEDDWLESLEEHPVTEMAGEGNRDEILPYSFYVDATPFSAESFYGIFITNLLTGISALCAILLKSEFCQCGCRGQCTLFEFHSALGNFLGAWAHKKHIDKRHDNLDWLQSDSERRDRAGFPTK